MKFDLELGAITLMSASASIFNFFQGDTIDFFLGVLVTVAILVLNGLKIYQKFIEIKKARKKIKE